MAAPSGQFIALRGFNALKEALTGHVEQNICLRHSILKIFLQYKCVGIGNVIPGEISGISVEIFCLNGIILWGR